MKYSLSLNASTSPYGFVEQGILFVMNNLAQVFNVFFFPFLIQLFLKIIGCQFPHSEGFTFFLLLIDIFTHLIPCVWWIEALLRDSPYTYIQFRLWSPAIRKVFLLTLTVICYGILIFLFVSFFSLNITLIFIIFIPIIIFFMIRLSFVFCTIILQSSKPLRAAWNLSKKMFWKLFWITFLLGLCSRGMDLILYKINVFLNLPLMKPGFAGLQELVFSLDPKVLGMYTLEKWISFCTDSFLLTSITFLFKFAKNLTKSVD